MAEEPVVAAGGPSARKSGRRGLAKVGRVVSNKMTKTVVVEVERLQAHKVYGRTVRITRRFMAHDDTGSCAVGDRVEIVESRPLSRLKRWRVARTIEKAS